MTYQEFLQKLAETPRDWVLEGGNILRRLPSASCYCPIEAVADMYNVHIAAPTIGLDNMLRVLIVRAADNCHGHDSQIRRDLLVACGLSDGPPSTAKD